MNDTKILCYCINVFDIYPTFLLPVFKDTDKEIYFAQCSVDNIIKDFEEIDIEQYKRYSKIYDIDTLNSYKIGDKAVFSIDYKDGFMYGSADQVITFYRNNHILFQDDEFSSYMSNFIASNSNLILESKNTLSTPCSPLSICNIINTLQKRLLLELKSTIYISDYNKRYERIIPYRYDPIMPYIYEDNFIYNYLINYSPPSTINIEIHSRIMKALFKKPAIYNLWNDKIIDAYIDHSVLYDMINLNSSFPDDFFIDDSFWKDELLPLEVYDRIKKGFKVFYLDTAKEPFNWIVAQDYNSKNNYIKLYKKRINSDILFEFSNELREDLNSKICFIIEEGTATVLLNDNIIRLVEEGILSFILPPQNNQIYKPLHITL